MTGSFAADGYLRVTGSPAGADGTVLVNGAPRDDYGMWQFLPPASYSVCSGAAPGYSGTPACQNAMVTAGGDSDVTGTYVP